PVLDLATIAGLPLNYLDLDGFTGVLDLRPLAGHPTLESVDLSHCPQLGDLSPLASMPKLRHLYLNGIPDVDLAPLAGRRRLTVWVDRDQTVRNAAGVRVRRGHPSLTSPRRGLPRGSARPSTGRTALSWTPPGASGAMHSFVGLRLDRARLAWS